MRQTPTILLLTLILLPIFWNGISLVHYAIEHTHTFCQSEDEHAHSNPNDCLSIFQLSEYDNHNQLPASKNSEFQELKQYITPNLVLKPISKLTFQQTNFVNFSYIDDLFYREVFLPPIFA